MQRQQKKQLSNWQLLSANRRTTILQGLASINRSALALDHSLFNNYLHAPPHRIHYVSTTEPINSLYHSKQQAVQSNEYSQSSSTQCTRWDAYQRRVQTQAKCVSQQDYRAWGRPLSFIRQLCLPLGSQNADGESSERSDRLHWRHRRAPYMVRLIQCCQQTFFHCQTLTVLHTLMHDYNHVLPTLDATAALHLW